MEEKTTTEYRNDVVQFLLQKSRSEDKRPNPQKNEVKNTEIENLTASIMRNIQQS